MKELKMASEMWMVNIKESNPSGINIKDALKAYQINKAALAFKIESDYRSANIIITDLTNFFFSDEDESKEFFELIAKYNGPKPETLYHATQNKRYKITR